MFVDRKRLSRVITTSLMIHLCTADYKFPHHYTLSTILFSINQYERVALRLKV